MISIRLRSGQIINESFGKHGLHMG